MDFLKKYYKTILIVLVLVFLLSSVAVAATSAIKYVYIERSDGKLIMINYQDALDAPKLYEQVVDGVQKALAGFRKVYVETENGVVIFYSQAVNDGLTYNQAVADGGYIVPRPSPDYEMYLDAFNQIKLRTPKPVEFPAWLDSYNVTWSGLAEAWVVDVFVDANELPNIYTLAHIDEMRIKGNLANRMGTTNRWRAVIPGDVTDDLDLEPGDVMIRIGTNVYY